MEFKRDADENHPRPAIRLSRVIHHAPKVTDHRVTVNTFFHYSLIAYCGIICVPDAARRKWTSRDHGRDGTREGKMGATEDGGCGGVVLHLVTGRGGKMAKPGRRPLGAEPPGPLPDEADTVKVTSVFAYDEVDELRRFLRANRRLGARIGQMEYIRLATLRCLREQWIPEQPA